MASIFKRKYKDGKSFFWRAVIRLKGHPSVCDSFERKQEAEDWAQETERRIKLGQYKFDQHNQLHTFSELLDRYTNDGALEHHRSGEDTLRHLTYWKSRIGSYALIHITPDLIGKERQLLAETPSPKGGMRTAATINRYTASLFSLLSYASRQLRWISENPCLTLLKLKENPGRDRVLSEEEIGRLLIACRESKSPYL